MGHPIGHKLKEQGSEKLGNFVLVAPMLRDSVLDVEQQDSKFVRTKYFHIFELSHRPNVYCHLL